MTARRRSRLTGPTASFVTTFSALALGSGCNGGADTGSTGGDPDLPTNPPPPENCPSEAPTMGGDCEEGLACNYPALPCGAQTATCGPKGWTLAEDRSGCAQDAGQTDPRPGDGTDGGGSSLEGAGGSAGNGGDAGGAGDGRMDAGSDGPQTTELPLTELPPTEPPMEVLDEGCPAETPARGTPCQTDRFCEYGEICAPGHALASCASGSWEVQPNPVACNPPPPEPEPAPAPGGLDEARDRRR